MSTKIINNSVSVQLSPHFNSREFVCKCGKCVTTPIDDTLISKLELLFTELNADKIIVNSGYRCSAHSVAVGGTATDAHTRGIAADITVYVNGAPVKPITAAAAAERVGFSGIGLMSSNIHVDVRNADNYVNAHWYGDETTGANVATFQTNVSAATDTTEFVKIIQSFLNKHFNAGLVVDGICGKNTVAALTKYIYKGV
jgi:hypothetical protein